MNISYLIIPIQFLLGKRKTFYLGIQLTLIELDMQDHYNCKDFILGPNFILKTFKIVSETNSPDEWTNNEPVEREKQSKEKRNE